MSEIKWKNGRNKYTRNEINYMLQTQRAMIHNDLKKILTEQSEKNGEEEFTENNIEILEYLVDSRRVIF